MATTALRIKDKDNGLQAVIRRLNTGFGQVSVGVFDGGSYDNGMTVVRVAEIHEFGLGVPRRSFLADWVDQNRDTIVARQRDFAIKILAGKLTVPQAWDQFGAWAVGQIRERITSGIEPALADSTIDRKGSSTPLIDTGQLWQSIAARVGSGR